MKFNPRTLTQTALLFILILFSACQKKINCEAETQALLDLDRAFSDHSREMGANTAFLDYMDSNAVLLRPNSKPIIGHQKIIERYTKPDTGFVLTWEPLFAKVSASGDLGYTYGIYTTSNLSPEGETSTNKGTYVTIWEKDKDGNWKFVLDTGNAGLERKKPDLE